MARTPLHLVHETALANPGQNASFVPAALAAANAEITILEECLEWLEADSKEAVSIRRDIEAIKRLPGYQMRRRA
ncbi:hypothetical protein ACFQH5_20420 [Halomonas salifodinae]|uniref:Uncharacterized protein n=1 Tax=Halomonas salifodinae TaxID=438745 RepID=A0ABW2F1H5_9GAMM